MAYRNPLPARRILIIQLGDIGDVVWTAPTLFAVRAAYPDARISLLLREGRGELLEGIRYIHKIFEVKNYRGSWWKRTLDQIAFLKDYRSQKFDLVFDLRADDRGAIMARLSGAPIRAALYYRDVSLLRNRMFTHLAKGEISTGISGPAEQSLLVVRAFGIGKDLDIPEFPVSEEIRTRVRALLPADLVHQSASWITISPFSRWSYKEWPYDKWIEIFNWLWDEYKMPVLVVGSKEERVKTEQMISACKGSVYNFAGRTRLSELVELIRMGCLHVGVDTGAPHIAAAAGSPTITLYGPSYGDGWAHPGKQHKVVLPDMECVPCHQTGCDNQHRSLCLETLKIDNVQKAIRESLAEILRKEPA